MCVTHASERLSNLLGALVDALSGQVDQAMLSAAGQGGGAPAALIQLARHPDLSVDELRRRLGLTHSGAVRLLDRLVERSLVVRRRCATDGRSTRLTLTPAGTLLAASVSTARTATLAEAMRALDAAERATLEPLLDRLLLAMPTSADHAHLICRLCEVRDCPPQRCPVEQRYQQYRHT